jgi:hypothetical protein
MSPVRQDNSENGWPWQVSPSWCPQEGSKWGCYFLPSTSCAPPTALDPSAFGEAELAGFGKAKVGARSRCAMHRGSHCNDITATTLTATTSLRRPSVR